MSGDDVGYFSATKICRLCLKSCENSVSLFDENNQLAEKPVKEFLEELCGISLLAEDNLPETACQQCYKQLADTRTFLIRIRKNDEFLHNIVQGDFLEESDKSNDGNIDTEVAGQTEGSSEFIPIENLQTNLTSLAAFETQNLSVKREILPEPEDSVQETEEISQYYEITYVQPNIEADEEPATTNSTPLSCLPETVPHEHLCRTKSSISRYLNCSYCDRIFTKKSDLTRHVNSHMNQRPFVCPVCSKSFFTQAELNRHMKIHNPTRDFKCPLCGKEFNEITAMKFHTRTVHNRERSHYCGNCGKAFSTASKVRRHQKSRICAETKSATTIHHGCGEQFIILEKQFVSEDMAAAERRDGESLEWRLAVEDAVDVGSHSNLFINIENGSL